VQQDGGVLAAVEAECEAASTAPTQSEHPFQQALMQGPALFGATHPYRSMVRCTVRTARNVFSRKCASKDVLMCCRISIMLKAPATCYPVAVSVRSTVALESFCSILSRTTRQNSDALLFNTC
jgi:hypothetical protein